MVHLKKLLHGIYLDLFNVNSSKWCQSALLKDINIITFQF